MKGDECVTCGRDAFRFCHRPTTTLAGDWVCPVCRKKSLDSVGENVSNPPLARNPVPPEVLADLRGPEETPDDFTEDW